MVGVRQRRLSASSGVDRVAFTDEKGDKDGFGESLIASK